MLLRGKEIIVVEKEMERRLDLLTGLYYDVSQEEITRRHNLVREYMEKKDISVLLVLASHKEGYRQWLAG